MRSELMNVIKVRAVVFCQKTEWCLTGGWGSDSWSSFYFAQVQANDLVMTLYFHDCTTAENDHRGKKVCVIEAQCFCKAVIPLINEAKIFPQK